LLALAFVAEAGAQSLVAIPYTHGVTFASAQSFFSNGPADFRHPTNVLASAGFSDTELTKVNMTAAQAWTSGNLTVSAGSWFRVDLGAEYPLAALKVWNNNERGTQNWTTRGIRLVDILVSTNSAAAGDVGQAPNLNDANVWTPVITGHQVAQGAGADNYEGDPNIIRFAGNPTARWVGFRLRSNWGDGSYFGISKMRFFTPPPLDVFDTEMDGVFVTNAFVKAEIANYSGTNCTVYALVAPADYTDWETEAAWLEYGKFTNGVVVINMTGLAADTEYVAQICASNDVAMVFGEMVPFATFGAKPKVVTYGPGYVGGTNAVARGEIIFCGGDAEEVDVWLYWGDEDETDTGDWSEAPVWVGKFGEGAVQHELFVLDYGSTYFYNFCASNALAGAFSPEAARIDTPGAPELGAVGHVLSPSTASASVTVSIVEPGAYPVLRFLWGADNAGNMTLAEAVGEAAIASPHVFEIAGLERGKTYWYAVELETPVGVDAKTNSFKAVYSYSWTGGNAGNWITASRWNPAGVPDGVGDIVSVRSYQDVWDNPNTGPFTISLAGMESATISELNLIPGYLSGTITIGLTTGPALIFTNDAAHAQINCSIMVNSYSLVNAPVRLDNETRVNVTHQPDSDFAFGGDITGRGPLVHTGGTLCFNVAAGVRREFSVPFAQTGGSVKKRGAGDFIFSGGSTSFSFKRGYDQHAPIGGGGAFVFSSHHHTNTTGFAESLTLFTGNGNKIIVTNASEFIFGNVLPSGSTYGAWSDNAILVRDAGSAFYLPSLNINGTRSSLRAEDGAYVRLNHANVTCSGISNVVWVGSATSDLSKLDLVTTTRTLTLNGTGCRLVVAAGGVVENGHVSVSGGAGNSLVLDGGVVNSTSLTVGAGNYIEPVLEALRGYVGFPVNVTDAVVNGKVLVRNPGKLLGLFPLVSAENPIANTGIEVEAGDGLVWKAVYGNGNRTLSVRGSMPNTLLIIK